MTQIGAKTLEGFVPIIFALAIGSYALSITAQGLKSMQTQIMICKDCFNRAQISTADFGGKFTCKICRKLVTMVPSIGRGVVCLECQKEGYCKYCGKRLIEII